ncbi:MAG: class I SAM-dependent methyltransferase [Steroidobacteraceae bacterium]
MTAAPVQDVSETALMVAVLRARENERARPLYRDQLALKLAGTRGPEIISGLPKIAAVVSTWMIAVRTRVVDDMIREAIRVGVDTVINLGAGLDTRPYRLELSQSLRWVEIDYPNIIDLKTVRLADEKPVCDLKRMPCDLTDPVALRALLSEVTQDTRSVLIVTEGVIPYLTNEEVEGLAEALRSSSTVRFWIADYSSPLVRKGRERAIHRGRMQSAPFRFDPQDYFGFFSSRGWRATKYVGPSRRPNGLEEIHQG